MTVPGVTASTATGAPAATTAAASGTTNATTASTAAAATTAASTGTTSATTAATTTATTAEAAAVRLAVMQQRVEAQNRREALARAAAQAETERLEQIRTDEHDAAAATTRQLTARQIAKQIAMDGAIAEAIGITETTITDSCATVTTSSATTAAAADRANAIMSSVTPVRSKRALRSRVQRRAVVMNSDTIAAQSQQQAVKAKPCNPNFNAVIHFVQ
eukprot:8323-Heterococcus_DN1.PRE.3